VRATRAAEGRQIERKPMKKLVKILPFTIALLACNNEQVTCNCADPSTLDFITNFSITKDTTYVDVNDDIALYPKIDSLSNGQLQIQQVVQVSCGYPKFSISSSRDTLIVYANPDTTQACVDWTAKFRYKASISIYGKCKYVHFINSVKFSTSSFDTVIKK